MVRHAWNGISTTSSTTAAETLQIVWQRRVRKGFWQGYNLSLCVFNILVEQVMQKALQGFPRGFKIGGKIYLQHLLKVLQERQEGDKGEQRVDQCSKNQSNDEPWWSARHQGRQQKKTIIRKLVCIFREQTKDCTTMIAPDNGDNNYINQRGKTSQLLSCCAWWKPWFSHMEVRPGHWKKTNRSTLGLLKTSASERWWEYHGQSL